MVDVTIHSLQSTIERCKGFISLIFFALKSQKKRVRKKESLIYGKKKNERGNVKKITTESQCLDCFPTFCQKADRKQRRRKLKENRQIDTVNRTQHGHNSAGCCTHIGLLGS